MKKLLFLLFLYLFTQSHNAIAMMESCDELARQRAAFETFMSLKDEYDREDLYAYLKRNDIDIHERKVGNTCLHMACLKENVEVARIVLERSDVDKNAITYDCLNKKETSLMLACEGGCKPFVELLLHHNVDINIEDNYGKTALVAACSERDDHPEIVSLLLARDDLDMSKEHGNANALLKAAEHLHYKALNVLYDCAKVNKEHKDDVNRNFFYIFVQKGKDPSLLHFFNAFDAEQKKEFLLEQLCQAACSTYDPTYAYCNKINVFVKTCNLHGVDWSARNSQGKRPVDAAEDEYNYLKGHVSYNELAWKRQILHTFLRHTPFIADWELFYALQQQNMEIGHYDVMRRIFIYYYMVAGEMIIERDIAFAMSIDAQKYWEPHRRSMKLLRNDLLSKKSKLFREIFAARLSQ